MSEYCDDARQEAYKRCVKIFKESKARDSAADLNTVLEFWDELPEDDKLKKPLAIVLAAMAGAVGVIAKSGLMKEGK